MQNQTLRGKDDSANFFIGLVFSEGITLIPAGKFIPGAVDLHKIAKLTSF
ncbi:hypothetical protein LZ575_16535 [Antarcticibacterium sp. 1MA-6-2]|nr:hypothetical protein [Antarcticibacterium sp. 1MA-6-2]UJH90422.1 hypothetical protein LZ575_16535 [Antarcticibacterium sp. 1MA-6-2]